MAENSIFGTARPPAVFNKKSPFNVFLGGNITKVEGLDGNLYANKFRTDTSTPLEVKRWPSKGKDAQGNEIPGDPIPQVIITVQSDALRDPANPADIGERCFYLEKQSLSRTESDGRRVAAFDTPWGAFFKALEDAGTPKDPKEGGELYMAKTGTAPGKGTQDRNLWAAKYTPPGAGVFTEDTPSSNDASEPSPFEELITRDDPKETLRAAAMLEINEANSIDDLKRIHVKYASKDIWTADEWRELGQKQLARPKVAASPFD
jgi:hypothetical protein